MYVWPRGSPPEGLGYFILKAKSPENVSLFICLFVCNCCCLFVVAANNSLLSFVCCWLFVVAVFVVVVVVVVRFFVCLFVYC